MSKCDRDCFNCKYDDCIVSYGDISKKERYEIRERDEKLVSQLNYGSLVIGKHARSKNRKKYYA